MQKYPDIICKFGTLLKPNRPLSSAFVGRILQLSVVFLLLYSKRLTSHIGLMFCLKMWKLEFGSIFDGDLRWLKYDQNRLIYEYIIRKSLVILDYTVKSAKIDQVAFIIMVASTVSPIRVTTIIVDLPNQV